MSIEAWVRPANTSQEGPARIVTLSVDPYPTGANFVLGQGHDDLAQGTLYSVRLRTPETNQYGKPALMSSAGTLTTDLTHVLYTRNVTGTTRLYLNGDLVGSSTVEGDFSNWDQAAALALANEPTGNRPWLGDLHLVAVYDRALTPAEVSQNYDAGPGTE